MDVLPLITAGQGACYADDGYIGQVELSVALQVLAEPKHVLKEDAGLDLNIPKTSDLPIGVTQQAASHNIIQVKHTLAHLSRNFLLASFCVLKVSLVSVCLLVLMLLYGTL
jgi:hypothetical protein